MRDLVSVFKTICFILCFQNVTKLFSHVIFFWHLLSSQYCWSSLRLSGTKFIFSSVFVPNITIRTYTRCRPLSLSRTLLYRLSNICMHVFFERCICHGLKIWGWSSSITLIKVMNININSCEATTYAKDFASWLLCYTYSIIEPYVEDFTTWLSYN